MSTRDKNRALRARRLAMSLSQKALAVRTCTPANIISDCERGKRPLTPELEAWMAGAIISARNAELGAKAIVHIFNIGTCYVIKSKPRNICFEDASDVFRYEGKQGIHHCFREIRGGWSRTYTDQQLIGKIIKEVE